MRFNPPKVLRQPEAITSDLYLEGPMPLDRTVIILGMSTTSGPHSIVLKQPLGAQNVAVSPSKLGQKECFCEML